MAETKKPTHNVFAIRKAKSDDKKDHFIEVGAAWPIKDGFKIKMDAVPVNGELVILARKEKK